jgi:hypothetical protein
MNFRGSDMLTAEQTERLINIIINQDWYYNPGYDTPEFEISTAKSHQHVCYVADTEKGIALAELLLAAHQIYLQMYEINISENYIIPGSEEDIFLKAFRGFVGTTSGW